MDKLDKQIREIKINRQPESFLDDIFMNLTEYIHNNYSNSIFYKKKYDLLFEYDSKNEYFYYDYIKIYLILKEKYCCNDLKINELIISKVEKHLKLKVKTTLTSLVKNLKEVEKHLKLKVKTTTLFDRYNIQWVEKHLKLKVKTTFGYFNR